MNKALVLVTSIAAVALAFNVKDRPLESVARLRGPGRGMRVALPDLDPAALAAAAGVDVPDATDAPGVPDLADGPPNPEAPEIPERIIDDLALAVVDKATPFAFEVYNELHVGPEGGLSWHTAGGKHMADVTDVKVLGAMLKERLNRPNVVVAHRDAVWQAVRGVVLTIEKAFQEDVYLGVATEDDPKRLRLLRFRQTGSATLPLPKDPVFLIEVNGEPGEEPEYSVNGSVLESFPADLAQAWTTWKKAHPEVASTFKADETRVVLKAHRFAAFAHVAQLVAVMREIGIETERIDGGVSQR